MFRYEFVQNSNHVYIDNQYSAYQVSKQDYTYLLKHLSIRQLPLLSLT